MSQLNEESPSSATGGPNNLHAETTNQSYPVDILYEARLQGFLEGFAARECEVNRLQGVVDGLYAQLWNPPANAVRSLLAKIDANAAREKLRGAA